MVPAVDSFLVIELLDGRRLFAIRKAHENVGHAKPNVSGVVALAEHIPLQKKLVVKDLFQVAFTGQFGKTLEIEQCGGGGSNKRRVRGGGNPRHLLEQRNILRMAAEL